MPAPPDGDPLSPNQVSAVLADLVAAGELIPAGDGSWLIVNPQINVTPDMLTHNINAADTTNADQLRTGGGLGLDLTGDGVTVGLWDGGSARSTHQELTGRITIVDAVSAQDHPTHVAGTIGATGVNASARGMASQVLIRSRDYNNDFAEMLSDAGIIDLSNHSYGNLRGWRFGVFNVGGLPADTWVADRDLYSVEDPHFGKYEMTDNPVDQSLHALGAPPLVTSSELDGLLHSNPHLLGMWSAGNDRSDNFQGVFYPNNYVAYRSFGPSGAGWYFLSTSSFPKPGGDGNSGTGFDSLPQDQVAKNNLVVGAINDITADPYAAGSVLTTTFSSWGPTDDGRIKPDVVGNGASLFSSGAASNSAYLTFSGTSMSAPNVTGTAALLVEHYRDLFIDSPLSATMKSLLIHAAHEAGNTGPDYSYGWGVVDGAAAANFLTDAAGASPTSHLQQNTYSGSDFTLDLTSDGIEPLKTTIAWTDPAGPAQSVGVDVSTSVLVNDLDLWITGPGGTYFPWTLNPATPSAAAVRATGNHRDNVEQVLIDAPAAGVYTIHIGRTGSSFTQDFSLAVSGATEISGPTADIVDVSPAPIQSSAGIVTINFSQDVLNVDIADFTLTRDGNAISLGALSVTQVNPAQYTIDLSSVTEQAGLYELTLNAGGSGITDTLSNPLAGDASDTWLMNAINGTAAGEDFRLALNISDPNLLNVFINNVTVTPDYLINLTNLGPNVLHVLSGSGDDALTVDYTNGSPVPAGGLNYDGGAPSASDSLIITGSSSADAISMSDIAVTFGGTITFSDVESIAVNSGGGDDVLTVNLEPNVDEPATLSLAFDGGSELDELLVDNGALPPFSAAGSQITHDYGVITHLNAETLTLDGSEGNLTGDLNGVNLNLWVGESFITASQHLGNLDIRSVQADVAPNGAIVLNVNDLTIAALAQLNLADNDLIVRNGTYASIESLVISGYDGGDWMGRGLASLSAAQDTNFLTALGIVNNASIGYTEFAGETGLAGSEILVGYTYYGDADLGKTVNLDDFNQFLFGYNNGAGGPPPIWLNGDFNYSGSVNLDDFNQFLFGLQNQDEAMLTARLSAAVAPEQEPIEVASKRAKRASRGDGAPIIDSKPARRAFRGHSSRTLTSKRI